MDKVAILHKMDRVASLQGEWGDSVKREHLRLSFSTSRWNVILPPTYFSMPPFVQHTRLLGPVL